MKAISQWRKESQAARRNHDLFPTDKIITRSFMNAERCCLARMGVTVIDEPACGRGDMAEVFKEFGFGVHASDIANRGYGIPKQNFLAVKSRTGQAMITNPAYKDDLPARFLRHAHHLGYGYVAMLLKVQYWNPQNKPDLWQEYRPAREYKICWRPDFLDLGGGMLDICFWVWDFTRRAKRTEVFLLTKDGRCV